MGNSLPKTFIIKTINLSDLPKKKKALHLANIRLKFQRQLQLISASKPNYHMLSRGKIKEPFESSDKTFDNCKCINNLIHFY